MPTPPTLHTPRLVLRPFAPEDAETVYQLASAREISDTMISVPHPLDRATAEGWMKRAADDYAARRAVWFAVTRAEDGVLVGSMALKKIEWEHRQASLSYWIGVPFWGRGYAGEAARRVVGYGFEELGLNRIYAFHMVRNPPSGRVLAKAGMRPEGVLRQRVCKWGVYEDVVIQAVLREEWQGGGEGESGGGGEGENR